LYLASVRPKNFDIEHQTMLLWYFNRRTFSSITLFGWLLLEASAGLLLEKITAGWLVAGAGLVWEKNTIDWSWSWPTEQSKWCHETRETLTNLRRTCLTGSPQAQRAKICQLAWQWQRFNRLFRCSLGMQRCTKLVGISCENTLGTKKGEAWSFHCEKTKCGNKLAWRIPKPSFPWNYPAEANWWTGLCEATLPILVASTGQDTVINN